MRNKLLFIVQCFLILNIPTVSIIHAQKKVLGKPEPFDLPIDCFENELKVKAMLERTIPKSKSVAWLVFSDRDDNPVYDKVNGSVVRTVKFRDAFFVTDENAGWIKIATGRPNGLKAEDLNDVGWVPKEKMLLWNSSLIDEYTRIHRKVLILNLANDINNVAKLSDKNIVEVFKGPNTSAVDGKIQLFDYYFVLKKENGKVLIAIDNEISTFQVNSIVGWIPEKRKTDWNTRICLEPNYTPAAVEERRNNRAFQIKAFGSAPMALEYCENPTEKPEDVYWKDDPVGLPKNRMAPSNPNRFKGEVVRWPMIGSRPGNSPNVYFYESGLVGTIKIKKDGSNSFSSEISEVVGAELGSKVQDYNKRKSNVNVFFIIEGTDYVSEYKNVLVDAVKGVNKQLKDNRNLRFGALVYRDLPEENITTGGTKINRLTNMIPLTSSMNDVVSFIEKTDFSNKQDTDDWTALYHGMAESLKKGGFRNDQLNIVFLVGCFGDFRANNVRKKDARESQHPALYEDVSPILENLAKLKVNLYSIQLRNDGLTAGRAFGNAAQYLILNSARIPYNEEYGKSNNEQAVLLLEKLKEYQLNITAPSMPEEGNDLELANGVHPGRLIRSTAGRALTPRQTVDAITKCFDESINFADTFYKALQKMYQTEGKSLNDILEEDLQASSGRFAPALAQFLENNLSDISRRDLENSIDEKFKLFASVYIPGKVKGAVYPSVSYVLFMPEADLRNYISIIEKCAVPVSTYPEKRRGLFEVYKSLVEQFSGDKISKKTEDLTREEVVRIMQGIYKTGGEQIMLEMPLNYKLGDIKDEKKIANEDIDVLIQRFVDVKNNLNLKLRKGEGYDFSYPSKSSTNRYYWIPLSEVF